MKRLTPERKNESLLDRLIRSEEAQSPCSSSLQQSNNLYNVPMLQNLLDFIANNENNDDMGMEETENNLEIIDEEEEEEEKEEGVNLVKCEYCDKQFTKKNNYSRHVNQHTLARQFNCRFCEKFYLRKDQWQNHLMVHFKNGFGFDCPVKSCQKKFHRHQDLRSHLDEGHVITSDSPARCKLCQKVCEKADRLLVHYQTGHEIIPFNGFVGSKKNSKPESADTSFEDFDKTPATTPKSKKTPMKRNIKEEIVEEQEQEAVIEEDKTIQKRPNTCDVCDKSFSNSGNLSRHQRSHLIETPHKCHDCNQYFTRQSNLLDHMMTHNKERFEPSRSNEISSVEPEEPSLKKLKNESEESDSQERDNTAGNDREENYNEHEAPVAQSSPTSPETAAICRKKPVSKEAVETNSTSSSESIFRCIPCGMTFDDINMFVVHRIGHTNDHPFECGHCGVKLDDRLQFNIHMIFSKYELRIYQFSSINL